MISVIVPIYNTGKYLDKCLESIKNQIFTDFEAIMIDDGSTDDSAKICKEFEKNDARFKYYYKTNGGSSSARNLGLKKASGEYIAFIDSDDSIDNDYLETLACCCKDGYDIIQCGMRLVRGEAITELTPDDAEYKDLEYIKLVLRRDYPIFLFQTTVTKLYSRRFIENSGVVFDEQVTKSEDCLFNTQLLPTIHSVKTVKATKYEYSQDNSFLSKQKTSFNKTQQSIRVGSVTADIRWNTIKKYGFEDEPDIQKGFQTAICIIYISNAQEIENGSFTAEEKQQLYNSFFSVMNYPIDKAIDGFEGTDKKIALACAKKDRKTVERIYKLRRIKKLLRG